MDAAAVPFQTTDDMNESIKRFIYIDTAKALMSVGDAWKQAFNDTVGEVHPQYNNKMQRC